MSHEVINLVAAILNSESTVPQLIMRSAKKKQPLPTEDIELKFLLHC